MKATGKRWTHLALYLGLVWAAGALVVPRAYRISFGQGLGLDVDRLPAIGIGAAAMVSVLAVGVAPVGHVVRPCRTASGRLGWAVTVFLGGTVGLSAGIGAWHSGALDVGGPAQRAALCGVPYALVAALFIAGVTVRLISGVAVLGVMAYGTAVTHKSQQEKEMRGLMSGTSLARQELLLPDPPAGYRVDEGNGTLTADGFRVHYLPYIPSAAGAARPDVAFMVTRLPHGIGQDGDGVTEATRDLGGGVVEIVLSAHRDGMRLTVTAYGASGPADRDELRRMLHTAHPASDAEVLRALRRPAA
ncbi:hypothetical protein ACH4TX_16230 [Streptomyces sp. NPDC021098]|uniref:hypothetical protein n=1 Tax=unclassified Streptomyces TaxID=2593676 RepID=UPI00378A2B1F